jgi:hypothetical protein
VTAARRGGVDAWISIPAIGWVAKDGDNAHRSTGVPADGGPPAGGSGDAIDGYDPTTNRMLTSVRSVARKPGALADPLPVDADPIYQDEWIQHPVARFGTATGGVRYYAFDNEPALWSSTHTDVHPVQPSYDDMVELFLEYASAIKDIDATARVTGPSLSGWTAMWYSARDRGSDNFRAHADRHAHGDAPFLPGWLDRVRQRDMSTGRRTLDALDVHYYPQTSGIFAPSAGDEATRRLRLRSTRSLWDPSYVDESWIGDSVRLIPRLREWRDQLYPGTALAIGEWNWGAEETMNGALAIANVLGIYGREGVDLAAYWTSPPPASSGARAFALYTNYDGQGHGFGDRVLAASSSAPADLAVYASRNSAAGTAIVVLLNHRPDAALPTRLEITGLVDHVLGGHLYSYDAANPSRIRDQGEVRGDANQLLFTLAPESASVLRLDLPA